MEGYIGDEANEIVCAAQQQAILTPQLEEGHRTAIVLRTKIEDQVKTVFSSMTIYKSRKHMAIFFIPKKNEKGELIVTSRSLVDFKADPAP